MKKYIDVMLDLETLGVGNSPVIIQIAAVIFDIKTGESFECFNEFINPKSGIDSGLDLDISTIEFWLKQDQEAIDKVIIPALKSENNLKDVLISFSKFIEDAEYCRDATVRVWGNGILADNKWIQSAYSKAGLKTPWKYNADNDVRTLVDLGKRILEIDPKKTIEFTGIKHDALHDCEHQIKYCSEIYKKLEEK